MKDKRVSETRRITQSLFVDWMIWYCEQALVSVLVIWEAKAMNLSNF
jgi:hypothetical protein